jgi:hypothetical protein
MQKCSNYFLGFLQRFPETNGKSYGSEKRDARVESELEEIIDQLERLSLIKATSFKREIFKVTAKGYELADKTHK